MSLHFRQLRHLLPRGRAWSVTADKPLRRFFEALAVLGSDLRAFVDLVWLDVFPATTRQLDEWEDQFAIPRGTIGEADRRLRLLGNWRAIGGQDPRYIQDTLQAAGFDVYVHEWWDPADTPAVGVVGSVTPRDPRAYLTLPETPGYPYLLVNRVGFTKPLYLSLAGEPEMQAGEANALAGNFFEFRTEQLEYDIPDDPAYWPYFIYIGAETFPNAAVVDSARQDELEALLLKICPYQHWLAMLVLYVPGGVGSGWLDLSTAEYESQDFVGDGEWLDLSTAEYESQDFVGDGEWLDLETATYETGSS